MNEHRHRCGRHARAVAGRRGMARTSSHQDLCISSTTRPSCGRTAATIWRKRIQLDAVSALRETSVVLRC